MQLDKKDREVHSDDYIADKTKEFYRSLTSSITYDEFIYFIKAAIDFLITNAHECTAVPNENNNLFRYESRTPRWLKTFTIYFTVEQDEEGEYIVLQDFDYN